MLGSDECRRCSGVVLAGIGLERDAFTRGDIVAPMLHCSSVSRVRHSATIFCVYHKRIGMSFSEKKSQLLCLYVDTANSAVSVLS